MTRSTPWLLALPLLVACGAPSAPPRRERAAELLRREDARDGDAQAWDAALRDPDPALRALAARALGRTTQAALAPVALHALERERAPEVREELLFALGQLGAPEARGPLLRAMHREEDPARRARAAEALGKLGQDPAVLERLLDVLGAEERPAVLGAALLALDRLHGARAVRDGAPPLEAGAAALLRARLTPLLAHPAPDVRWKAAYALADLDLPDAASLLLGLLRPGEDAPVTLDAALRDRTLLVRLFAARGLARRYREHRPEDPAAVRGLLGAARDPHLAAALAGLVGGAVAPVGSGDPVAAAPPAWAVDELLEAADRRTGPGDHHLRAAALTALEQVFLCAPPPADGVPPPGELPSRVERGVRGRLFDESATVRGEALAVLARLQPQAARAEVEAFAGRADALDRVAAARAAARLEALAAGPLLERLSRDPDPRVACEALDGLGRRAPAARARATACEALGHEDLAVRATAMAMLGEKGEAADGGALLGGFLASPGPDLVEVRTEAVKAAAAILGRLRQGRTAWSAAPSAGELLLGASLLAALHDPTPAVLAGAGEALQELSGAAPALPPAPPVASTVQVQPGVDLLRADPTPVRVELETTKGSLLLELFPEAAPRHVRSFLDLAGRGFYDGLRIHRVVTGFVVQGLDPRGDGWGSGGVVLRDEIHGIPYDTGTVGMPNAGPDTGGCQLFVTHIPTPHLDGRYTVFGRVREGMDVLDALEVGDLVRRVRVRGATPGP